MAKSIPVKVLQFATPVDLPGKPFSSSVSHQMTQMNRSLYTIEFYPLLRSFKITYQPPEKPEGICFVPESRVTSWEPLGELDF